MSLHVIKAVIQVAEHIQKVLSPHKVTCAGGVQPPSDRLEVRIVLQIGSHIVRKLNDALLIGYEAFALSLEFCCLDLHSVEGFGERREQI
jgi:hypothetical protein